MIRLAPFLLALTTPALAEPPYVSATGDTIELRQCDPWPCIYYLNDGAENSNSVTRWFRVHGVEIRVKIGFAEKSSAETITVEPMNQAVIAEPPYAEVDDGGEIYIDLLLPLY